MGSIRYTVSPNSRVALRFDDEDFLAALQSASGDFHDQLERLLGGPPAEADLSAFVDDGVVLHARAGVTGRQDAKLGNASLQDDARKGMKVDIARANESLWGLWVVAVEDADNSVPAELSERDRAKREEAFALLPAPIADAFMARLRVHIRDANADALRDPDKVKPRASTGKDQPLTFDSVSGEYADAETSA